MYFILGDRLAIVQDRKTKPSEKEFARSACIHVAIMGEAQCMMIEASMLSANDHETSLVMCVCVCVCVYDFFVTFYIHYGCQLQDFPYLLTDHTIFMFALCVTVGLYWSV